MKKLFVFLVVLGVVMAGSSFTRADFSWQTQPILGYSASSVTGDVVVVTGPTPTTPGGGFYYDVDGNIVLGPTIPHYSIAGDPLEGIGSPSVTTFYYNPNVWSAPYWHDPNVWVYSGSGVNLEAGSIYHYTGTYSFLGTPGNAAYDVVAAENNNYTAPASFIMLTSGVGDFWREDAGQWRYTETWTDTSGASISSTREFSVARVPEPATMLLLGLGLTGFFGLRRKDS